MRSLICDLCNSDERVLTYTINSKPINVHVKLDFDSFFILSSVPYSGNINIDWSKKEPKVLEICNKCVDQINQNYKDLLEKFGLQNYAV